MEIINIVLTALDEINECDDLFGNTYVIRNYIFGVISMLSKVNIVDNNFLPHFYYNLNFLT